MSGKSTAQKAIREEDRRLLRAVAEKDEDAFDQLYLSFHPRLTRFLMSVCARYEVAEEVINDTMLVVWNDASDFRGDSSVSSWIMAVAYRKALNAIRNLNTAKRKETEASDFFNLPLPDQQKTCERSQWLDRGLAQLPIEQRTTIELAYTLGHSCKEISIITDVPVNTVKSRLFKARKKLRELLPDLADDGEQNIQLDAGTP